MYIKYTPLFEMWLTARRNTHTHPFIPQKWEEKTGKVAEKFNKKQEKLQAKAMDNATKEKSSARKGRVTKGSEGDKVEKRPRGRPRKGDYRS